MADVDAPKKGGEAKKVEMGPDGESMQTFIFIRVYVLVVAWVAGSYLFLNKDRFVEMARAKGHKDFYINFLLYGFATGFTIVNVTSLQGIIYGPSRKVVKNAAKAKKDD